MWLSRTRLIFLFLLAFLICCSSSWSSSSRLPAPKTKLKIAAVFGHLGKSHFDVFKPLLQELARRGHDLTVISHFPRSGKEIAEEPLPNYKDISLINEKVNLFVNVVDLKLIDHSIVRIFKDVFGLCYMASIGCDVGLNNPQVKELVESDQKFDLVLTENFNTECFMILVHKLKAPFIQISTHQLMPWVFDQLGISSEANHIPALFSRLPRPMNLIERTWNVITIAFITVVHNTLYRWNDESMVRKAFGPDIPNLIEIRKNSSMMFVNTHYSLHGAVSLPPYVVEVGGLHIPQKVNPLPKDIAMFLDDAHEGVLYFNLGSMVKMSTMPQDKLNSLLKVLASIPRKVIWKWETDDMPMKFSNVLIKKWLPQYDIMNHPNVKCYFGHGGLLGLSEGVYSGLPMVLMPLYGDQYQNAMAAKARGVAEIISYNDLNEQTLRHALDEVFNNTKFYENAQKLKKAYRDRPATPLETAVWWTEYVARGDGLPYLKSDGSKMPWYQRKLLDVAALLLVFTSLVLYAVYQTIKCIRSQIRKKKSGNLASKKTN